MATDILNDDDIKKVLDEFKDPGSFNPKTFFEMMKLNKKSNGDVKLFNELDKDGSKSIDEKELKSLLKVFDMNARDLTDDEANDFLKAIDKDGSGKIDEKEFVDFARS
ncbi:parvalbumin alpha-like [Neoarius graeffei]|uniref:parvalbumin alpha-like n=1 Tax=Neoarius graeffei TaxID=443677 RepID=UPI00298C57B0|nr:parvalbumin alpha-like [Neoarius graeffei]